jgi:hypothetical protein
LTWQFGLAGATVGILPERALRIAFAFILVLSGIKLVEVPAATTIIEAGVGLGAVLFVVWSIRQLQQRRVPAPDAA